MLYIKSIDDYILFSFKYQSNCLIVCRCLQVWCACCRWLVNWAVINRRILTCPCGLEEPLLALKVWTGKYACCGHSPTSQPGNGSRELQGKTSRQSGRGERQIESQIVVLSYFVHFYLLYFYFTVLCTYSLFMQPRLHLWR